MGIWNIFGKFATSDNGETIHKVSATTSVSTNGTVYTTMGPFTQGSDGSEYTQTGSFSSDGSTRMGSIGTGLGGRHAYRSFARRRPDDNTTAETSRWRSFPTIGSVRQDQCQTKWCARLKGYWKS